jgi:hypothetical protein
VPQSLCSRAFISGSRINNATRRPNQGAGIESQQADCTYQDYARWKGSSHILLIILRTGLRCCAAGSAYAPNFGEYMFVGQIRATKRHPPRLRHLLLHNSSTVLPKAQPKAERLDQANPEVSELFTLMRQTL